jgi:hypothetical protein
MREAKTTITTTTMIMTLAMTRKQRNTDQRGEVIRKLARERGDACGLAEVL